MTVSRDRHIRALAVSGLAMWFGLAGVMFSAPAASASQPITTVRLGMTGMVTSSDPDGEWSLHARPGQTLGFVAGFVPGLEHMDAKKVLSVHVSVDAEHLPGGSRGKPLQVNSPYQLTLHKPGSYPLHWNVALVLNHGHKSIVETTREFNATIVVAGSSKGNSPGLVNTVSPGSTPARTTESTSSSRNVVTTPHQAAGVTGSAAAQPASSAPPTFTLPADTGAARPPNPEAIAPLPDTTADTYLFTAVAGTFLIGLLWLLWVASIKPILGR